MLITKVTYKPSNVPAGTTYHFNTYINNVLALWEEITVVSA
jgi:hypothetical protein